MKLFVKFSPCYARPIHVKKLPNQSNLKKSKFRKLEKKIENKQNIVNKKLRKKIKKILIKMPILSK